MHNLRVTTLAEVNHFVIKQYKAFMNSEIGKEQRQLRTCAADDNTQSPTPEAVLTCLSTSPDCQHSQQRTVRAHRLSV
jgi:hypothetical protein